MKFFEFHRIERPKVYTCIKKKFNFRKVNFKTQLKFLTSNKPLNIAVVLVINSKLLSPNRRLFERRFVRICNRNPPIEAAKFWTFFLVINRHSRSIQNEKSCRHLTIQNSKLKKKFLTKKEKFSEFQKWSQTSPNMPIPGQIQKKTSLRSTRAQKLEVFFSYVVWNKMNKITLYWHVIIHTKFSGQKVDIFFPYSSILAD